LPSDKNVKPWTVILIPNNAKTLKRLRTVVLVLATFFNPLGFDALFHLVMTWTKSYWITDAIFYGVSAFFFGLYFLLSKDSKSK
jgi:hypothetical protein